MANKKGRMVNLCGRPTDSVTGDYGTVGNLYDIGYDWPWTTWLKPQIDAAYGLGANVVRLISDATLRVGDASHHGGPTWRGTITAQDFADRLDQLITYLDSLGMYFYATAVESWAAGTAGLSAANIQAYLEEYVALVTDTQYTNVVGIDLCQEFDATTGSEITGNLAALIAASKAARSRLLPVTCSVFSFTATGTPWGADPTSRSTYATLLSAGADYIDNHFYTHMPTPAELVNLFALGVPVVIGEIGINFNGSFDTSTVDGASAGKRATWYDGIVALSQLEEIQATGIWAAVQMSDFAGNDWGLFGKTQDGSNVLTDPRTEMTTRFATVKTAYQGVASRPM